MTEADRIFARFPSFIQDFIYQNNWESLREVQRVAAKAVFETDCHLLLSSSTASGKTEAAFFPIITELCESSESKGGASVLYIAPLKSLINDQFARLSSLLEEAYIPVTHWHGDVSASKKSAFLKEPSGILQITPESLESLLIRRNNDIPRLFADLRYIVIDEVHALIGTDRGNQVICQLTRLARLLGHHPRRIGLSATIGDLDVAAAWLGAGTEREVIAPRPTQKALQWRLGFEHFYIQEAAQDAKPEEILSGGDADASRMQTKIDAGYEFAYDAVCDKKALVFSNSREETEYVTATLRQIARMRGDDDIFHIHHGNLSASLREGAEMAMKEETRAVTCATVTMELGIDIGRLERVVQMGAPHTVSAFLQRLGRSGRRGSPPEMIEIYREDIPLPNDILPHLIPWELLRGIALVQLYGEERFIEPPRIKKMPLSLAFHQTLSVLSASGELTAKALAERILTMPPLSQLSRECYRELLLSMVQNDYLELTEEKGLIIGLKGEKLVDNFRFYAVFKDSEDFTVRAESDEMGTITSAPPVGERFALAGRVWEVLESDVPHRLIYVKAVEGKMEVSWPGDSGEVHTKILERMRKVLFEETVYPYLLPHAAERLRQARHLAERTNMEREMLLSTGGYTKCLFPWLGTRAFRTLKRFLQHHASELGLSDVASEGCYYITFKSQEQDCRRLLEAIKEAMARDGMNTEDLVASSEFPAFEKFDPYLPASLLRRAYAVDRLCPQEMLARFGVRCHDPF